ncbi:hypothetical protein F4861DRAFT_507005 [Xylaria intraflava]|nr:hypothetical protein F4861DRAFT_507005 [Xylaria intraflava]
MRASIAALSSFVALAAANLPGEPPNENVTITVGSGSSLSGYQLVANGVKYPELVPAAQASGFPNTWYLFWTDLGHIAYYSLSINITGTKWELAQSPVDSNFQGPWVLAPPNQYGIPNDIWDAENDSPDLKWDGDTSQDVFGCTNDAKDIQIAVYSPGKEPKGCEKIQLEYKAVAEK